MFEVEQAPEWKDDVNCFRCRTEFTTFNRKVSVIFKISSVFLILIT